MTFDKLVLNFNAFCEERALISGPLMRATKSPVHSIVQYRRAMVTRLTDIKHATFEQLAINSKAFWKERIL
jgi:hypothetical protein